MKNKLVLISFIDNFIYWQILVPKFLNSTVSQLFPIIFILTCNDRFLGTSFTFDYFCRKVSVILSENKFQCVSRMRYYFNNTVIWGQFSSVIWGYITLLLFYIKLIVHVFSLDLNPVCKLSKLSKGNNFVIHKFI